MKKLILSAAFVFATLSLSAQTTPTTTSPTTTSPTGTTTSPTGTTTSTSTSTSKSAPQTTKNSETTTTQQTTTQTDTEVKTADVPASIVSAVKSAYPGAVINSVSVNNSKEYTINLTAGGKTGVIYADSTGKWIKKD